MQPTLSRSSLRAFFMTAAAVIGFFFGLFVVILCFSILQSADRTPTQNFTAEIEPNANMTRKVLSNSAPVVLKINVQGPVGVEPLNAQTMSRLLVESRENTLKNNRVKAILLHINTPGGTVTDADSIYRQLLAYKARYNTPIYAYVDGMCASGGMYIASAADKIFASDVSLIGSVGVLAGPFINASELIKTIGLTALTLSEGKGKDALNPLRPWKEGEAKPLKDIMNYYYNSFVDIVTSARPNLSKEKLINEYGAEIFPATIAKEHGFIDIAGASYEETLKALLKEIDIDDNYYQVVSLSQTAWASLFKSKSSILSGSIQHKVELPGDLKPEFMNQMLYLYRP